MKVIAGLCAAALALLAAGSHAFAQGVPVGRGPKIDFAQWRLSVAGPATSTAVELSYDELAAMPAVTRREQLICPGLFAYFADWEGIPLSDVLARAGIRDPWTTASFSAADGYTTSFSREEVEAHPLLIILKKNGEPLPPEEGFPARLLAEGLSGGRWLRWLTRIEVQ